LRGDRKLIALVLPLALDTFAVAAALGLVGVPPERRLRISLLFTAFEASMPLVGVAIGAPLGRAIGAAADYGVSISLDELAIGFTLGLLRLPVAPVIVLIAVQTFIVTQVGLRVGSRLNDRMREGAERLAGVALTCLGLILLAEKLFG
jgi:putative Mn2+ efflux pump MntP